MSKAVVFMGWAEAPHLDEEGRKSLAASYLPHELDARTKGVPSLGVGAIYPVAEGDVVCEAFDLPAWWPRCYGMDVGWNRTAAVWLAWDRDTDVAYAYSEHYRAHAEPSVHAAGVRSRGEWIPGVIDPASRGRGQRDGEQLLQCYVDLGLKLMLAENGVEAGLLEVWQRLTTGRLKFFPACVNLLKEFRFYHRDEKGRVVKEQDHALDALRYAVVSGLQNAVLAPDYLEVAGGGRRGVVSEYDPFAERAA